MNRSHAFGARSADRPRQPWTAVRGFTIAAALLLGVATALAGLPPAGAQIQLPPLHAVPQLRTFNGTADSKDQALAVATDAQNNVVTAGFATNVGAGQDWVVRKYSSAGAVLWTRFLDGTGPDDFRIDVAHAVGVDSHGSVFAAGTLDNVGTRDDFAVAKWDANGNLQWVRTLDNGGDIDQARDLAVDNQDNVIVVGELKGGAGGIGGRACFTVMRWDGAGNPCPGWHTNGVPSPRLIPADSDGAALAVAVDSNRNIVAAGYTSWVHAGEEPYPNGDFTVMKWDEVGNPLWLSNGAPAPRLLNGSNYQSFDEARDVTVTPEGDVIATGQIENATTKADLAVMKWYANGMPASGWRNTFFTGIAQPLMIAGPYHSWAPDPEHGSSVKVDAQSNIYVAGAIAQGATDQQFALVKVKWDKTVLWQNRLDGGANQHDEATALVLDQSGRPVVCGHLTRTAAAGPDFAVIFFDANGAERGRTVLTGSVNGFDGAFDLAIDTTGWVSSVGTVTRKPPTPALDHFDYAVWF
jgi:uncharacterized delta-60 repeat protein